MSYPVENAIFQWEDGWRAYRAIADQRTRRLAERVVEAIREELRRRIGPTFTTAELAELYGRGTEWSLQVAIDLAPAVESDAHVLADAAFWIYLRGATDFAGGRQLPV